MCLDGEAPAVGTNRDQAPLIAAEHAHLVRREPFEHLRVQVGGVLPPGGRVLPTRLETWPVLPAVELSWDFMLR